MKIRSRYHVVTATLLLGAAFAASAHPDNRDSAASGSSAADTVFIEKATEGGMAEMQMARTALTKSSNDKVKALAQRIIDDHTKANEALKTLAQNKKVSFPSNPSKDAQKENDSLQAMKPAAFDVAWSKAMVSDHQDAIKLFMTEGKDTQDAELQRFVKDSLPMLKSHLEAAQQLAVVPDARDQAMDQASKSITSALDSTPATSATTATSPSIKPATPAATPATMSGKKH